MANYTTAAEASVSVDVSLARSGVREAIRCDIVGLSSLLNPGQVRRFADDLIAAADLADSLCPPRALKAVNGE